MESEEIEEYDYLDTVREEALEQAMTLRQHGIGGPRPEEIVEDAKVFEAYLRGTP